MGADLREVITHPTYSLPFLQPGRLVKIKHQQFDFGWGIIVNYQKRIPPKVSCFHTGHVLYLISYQLPPFKNRPVSGVEDLPPHEQYVIDVLLNCAKGSLVPKERNLPAATPGGILPCPPGEKGEPLVVPVLLSTLDGISLIRIHMPKDLRSTQARETTWKSVLEVHRRFPKGITLLDPIQHMKITDEKLKQLLKVREIMNASYQSIINSIVIRKSTLWRKR